jgi:hypothetical protein
MRTSVRSSVVAAIAALIAIVILCPSLSSPISGASLPRLFDDTFTPVVENGRGPRLHVRGRRARAALGALDAPALALNLFDDTELAVTRTNVEHPRAGRTIWHGRGDDGSQAVFTVVNGAMAGTLYRFGQTYEVTGDSNGLYQIAELDAASFPTDDPDFEGLVPPADVPGTSATSTAPVAQPDGVPQIDMMVLWTPAARNSVGGTQAAIESLVQSAVANANLAYTNSGINAHLNLVHAEEVPYTETNINFDLQSLQVTTDGILDNVHALRDQYGADIVTMIGNGYASTGVCGVGYLMNRPGTWFQSWAFNVVDRSCAAGYLSYAHEVGHNEGLLHDPANSTGTPSYPYAYGYQDPSGAFRTVMSYGGAQRIPFFSNPNVFYNGLVTGTATQNNAAALNLTAPVVAQFRPTAGSPPPCTYTVSPTSMSFSDSSGSATVSVATTSGCTWSSSSGAAWATVTGSGSGTVTVSAQQNTGAARSATVTIAGQTVTVNQAALPCSYAISPASLSVPAAAGTATIAVTTTSGCAWTTSSSASWVTVSAGTTGSGTATLTLAANTGAARSATVVVAGRTITISQAAMPCSYTVSPASLSVPADAVTASLTVTTTSACAWTTSSSASWVTVSAGTTGTGSATLTIAANTGGARSASITVAGQTVTVTQAAMPCSYGVSPTLLSFPATAGSTVVTVTTSTGCSWSSASSSWATVTGSGSTGGTATISVPNNTGAARSTTVVVAGKTVSISQAAGKTKGPKRQY